MNLSEVVTQADLLVAQLRQDPAAADEFALYGLYQGHEVPPDVAAAVTRQLESNVIPIGKPGGLVLEPLSGVEDGEVRWLTKNLIPLGALTVLAGDPGLGKSTYCTFLSAAVTRGLTSGDLAGMPSEVMFLQEEDDPASTIKPRMLAAGANVHRVHLLSGSQTTKSSLTIPQSINELEQLVKQIRPKLIVFDPLVAFFSQNVNSNNNQDVRRALTPLVRMAIKYELAIVAINHLNKMEGTDLLKRLGGSGGLAAAARSVLFFGRDPANPTGDTRILAQGKGNLGAGESQKFQIEEAEGSSKLTYLGKSPFGVEDSIELGSTLQEVERQLLAVKFLEEELMLDAQPAAQLRRTAQALGLTDKNLTFARKETGAYFFREPSSGGWMLELPNRDGKTPPKDV